jgi:hypothetical protein
MSCEGQLIFLANNYALLSTLGYATSDGLNDSAPHCKWFNLANGATATTHKMDYDLGVDYASIPPADCLAIFAFWEFIAYGGTVTVAVKAADDSSYSTGLVTVSLGTVALGNLCGLTNKDWYAEFSGFSVSKRYWRIEITTTNSINPPIRDLILGNKIVLSKNPVAPINYSIIDDWCEAKRNSLNLELKYEGLSHADRISISDSLLKYSDVNIFALIDRDNNILFGKKLMRAYLDRHLIRLKESGVSYRAELKIIEAL